MADQELADVVVRKENCPECGKRNSLVHYADDTAQCFTKGCGHRVGQRPDNRPKMDPIPRGLVKPDDGSWKMTRRITVDTLRRYGSFLGAHSGDRQLVTPVYDNTGVMVAQQMRLRDGTVRVIGERGSNGRQLGGQHVYGDRFDKRVVVHSDALDAMSTAQTSRFTKYASVHVLGDHPKDAPRELKDNYRWLDRFQEIILFFQDTPAWQQAAQTCAAIFPAGKVKLARIGDAVEGPNAALQANRPGDIEQAIWSATPWRPMGIVNAAEGLADLFKEGLQTPSWPYPWPEFNECFKGMRPGEVTYHVGGTGIAKTTLLFHYATHLLTWDGREFLEDFPRQEPAKVGWLGFEDLTKQVKLGMLGIYMGRMLSLEKVNTEEALRKAEELFGQRRLELFDPETAEYGLESVKSYVRYMTRALDCKVVILDPLTAIIDMLPAANRTQEEDQIASWLAQEAKATQASFHVGYHLKKPDGKPFEEGRHIGINDIKGSGALTRYSHNVIAYRRNQQGDRPDLLEASSLKNRVGRQTGPITCLTYSMETGRYTPTAEQWPDDDDSDNQGNSKRPRGGFTKVGGGDY